MNNPDDIKIDDDYTAEIDIERPPGHYDPYPYGPNGIDLNGGLTPKRPGYINITEPNDDPNIPDIHKVFGGNLGQNDYIVDKESNRVWSTGIGPTKVSMSQIGNPNEFPCEHQPIDVGFARTKIVCKKCNKDL